MNHRQEIIEFKLVDQKKLSIKEHYSAHQGVNTEFRGARRTHAFDHHA